MVTERQAKTKAKKVFLVDDHPIVRQGMAQLIEQESDLFVCGEAEDAPQALQGIEKHQPDVVLVDISLKSTSGVDLIKDLKIRHPRLPVLVLSMHDESFYAERVLRAGARGYVTKEEATEKVLTAIRQVLRGEVYLSDRMAARMLSKLVNGSGERGTSPTDRLTDRELQIFECIGRGLGTREVAQRMHLSVKTIESHRANIKRKLNLDNATQLLQHAIQWVQSGGGSELGK